MSVPLVCEFWNLSEKLERLRVGQRFNVANLSPVYDVGDGQLGELVAAGAGEVIDCYHLGRHVARGAVLTEHSSDGSH